MSPDTLTEMALEIPQKLREIEGLVQRLVEEKKELTEHIDGVEAEKMELMRECQELREQVKELQKVNEDTTGVVHSIWTKYFRA